MPLTLNPKNRDTIPIEAEALRPDRLAGKTLTEIKSLKVFHGNREEDLGACFDIAGDSSDEHLLLEGDFSRIKHIGQEMVRGRITIDGRVGMHLGAEMRGGEIEVRGDAGDWVGAEMRGGLIRVSGSAGHLVGGSYRGSASGMKGGAIIIGGDAGNEVGCGMRRGVIAVGGKVSDFAGFNMIAGTILVNGGFGIRCGAGMRRGSIIALGPPKDHPPLLPSFRFDCEYEPQFLSVYLNQLRKWDFPVESRLLQAKFHRYSGDLVALGKGEVLLHVDHDGEAA